MILKILFGIAWLFLLGFGVLIMSMPNGLVFLPCWLVTLIGGPVMFSTWSNK